MNSLGPDARALLRLGKHSDEPSAEQCEGVVRAAAQRFEAELRVTHAANAKLEAPLDLGAGRRARKAVVWLMVALVSSASVGAWGAWSEALRKSEWFSALWTTLGPGVAQEMRSGGLSGKPTVVSAAGEPVPSGARGVAADFGQALPAPVALPSAQDPSPADDGLQPKPDLPSALGSVSGEQSSGSQSARGAEPAEHEISLGRELQLIASARSALERQDYAGVKLLTARHAQEFSSGQLLPERLAIAALAECHASGETRMAREFVDRYPSSLLAARVNDECRISGEHQGGTALGPETHLPSNSVPAPSSAPTHFQRGPSRGSF
jgi:hypothetical protein